MYEFFKFLLGICAVFILGTLTSAQAPNRVPYRRVLDSGRVTLEWQVNRQENTITLTLTVLTRGYVTIGLTRKGVVEGGDFVVAGIDEDGRHHAFDMHGTNNSTLAYDAQQDWEITDAPPPNSRSFKMSISRKLDTCDNDDMILNQDLIHVVWDYNSSPLSSESPLFMTITARGILPIYLLDQELPPINAREVQTWRLSRTIRIPGRHTTYWCSIQKAPRLSRIHHIIGNTAYFRDELSRKHVHHKVAFRCVPPEGVDAATFFEPFASHPGHECYLEDNPVLPIANCRQIVYLYGIGGYPMSLTDDVGFPFGEEENEYYMLESHYDNPEERSDLVIEDGIDFHYTPRLREKNGGMIVIGYGVATRPGAANVFAVPPETTDFTIGGQCSPRCTRDMVPTSGLEVFAVTLHAHLSARKMRLRHFRGNRELPWPQSDNNYDFNFQQYRVLPQPVTILPGDHLVNECDYDSTWRDGIPTVSGFSTRDEMCNAFLYIKQRIPYMQCNSEYDSQRVLDLFGIRNTTWDRDLSQRIVTSAVSQDLIGQTFSEVVAEFTDWTPAAVQSLENLMRYSTHVDNCPTIYEYPNVTPETSSDGSVTFPRGARQYQPPTCTAQSSRADRANFEVVRSDRLPGNNLKRPVPNTDYLGGIGKVSQKRGWGSHI